MPMQCRQRWCKRNCCRAAAKMMHLDATSALVERVRNLSFAQLTPSAIKAAKTFIADSFGVALAGHRGAFANGLRLSLPSFGSASDARIWGDPRPNPGQAAPRYPAASAAMMNAYLIHCQEFDCVHEPAVVHPMAVILATLMAECERRPELSGADLLLGVIAAVDVAASLGMASQSPLRFFRPAQCGGLGAVAALAKWSGLDIRNAFGVMLGQLSGTMQAHREGAPLLPMQIAFSARNAIVTLDLCRHGLQGPNHALEGEFGYLALFEGQYDLTRGIVSLGSGFAIEQVSHKPYPSGRATHGGLHALIQLQEAHKFSAGDVAAVRLYAPPLVRQLVDRKPDGNKLANYQKLCFPYCAATLLITGNLGVLDFEAAALAELERFALAEKITVLPDANTDPNALAPVRVELDLTDGRCLHQSVTDVLGAPTQPLSANQHRQKFMSNWQLHFGTERGGANFLALIDRLEELPSAAKLVDL